MEEVSFLPAYDSHQRHWVLVPLFHLPEGALDEETGQLRSFKVTILDGEPLGKLETRDSTPAMEKIARVIKACIIPRLWKEKSLKELCLRNDIPLAWVTDRFPRKKRGKGEDVNRREIRKNKPLLFSQFSKIRRKLNKPTALILNILWYLNHSLEKGGGFITLEEILRLRIEAISPESEDGSNWIRLMRHGMTSTQLVVHFLPPRLWKTLCQQIHENSPFVFSNRYGAPLLPVQIEKDLKIAALAAGFKDITTLSLRPTFDKKREERIRKKNAATQEHLEPVTSEEWKEICHHIPAIMVRRGRKSSHNPLHLLNAILHHMRTGKYPFSCPSASAVESQHRRWKKGKILDAILEFRKSKLSENSTGH